MCAKQKTQKPKCLACKEELDKTFSGYCYECFVELEYGIEIPYELKTEFSVQRGRDNPSVVKVLVDSGKDYTGETDGGYR